MTNTLRADLSSYDLKTHILALLLPINENTTIQHIALICEKTPIHLFVTQKKPIFAYLKKQSSWYSKTYDGYSVFPTTERL